MAGSAGGPITAIIAEPEMRVVEIDKMVGANQLDASFEETWVASLGHMSQEGGVGDASNQDAAVLCSPAAGWALVEEILSATSPLVPAGGP